MRYLYLILLSLAFGALCPIYASGDDLPGSTTTKTKQKEKEDPSTTQTDDKQKSSTTEQGTVIIKKLFKDATYENFASQKEEQPETKIFDESYLGS